LLICARKLFSFGSDRHLTRSPDWQYYCRKDQDLELIYLAGWRTNRVVITIYGLEEYVIKRMKIDDREERYIESVNPSNYEDAVRKSRDYWAEIRDQRVQEIQSLTDQNALAEIARTEMDAGLRQAAISS